MAKGNGNVDSEIRVTEPKIVMEFDRREFIIVANAVIQTQKLEVQRKVKGERDSERAMRLADYQRVAVRFVQEYQKLPKR